MTWKKDDDEPIVPYGLWLLPKEEFQNPIWIVEGESDCWATWALSTVTLSAFQGAKFFKCLKAEHIKNASTLYIWQKTDTAGGKFAADLCKHLKNIAPDKKVFVICQEKYKDAVEFFKANPTTTAHQIDNEWLVNGEAFLTEPEAANQTGISEAFVKWIDSHLLFNAKLGGYLKWSENRYVPDANSEAYLSMKKYLDELMVPSPHPNKAYQKKMHLPWNGLIRTHQLNHLWRVLLTG